MRKVTFILSLMVCLVLQGRTIADMEGASDYVRTAPMQRIEGIWQLCDQTTRVLIHRDERDPQLYKVTIIDSDDARLLPGDVLGTVSATPDPVKYRLTLRLWPGRDEECAATLIDSDRAIVVERPKHTIKITPRIYLPGFWTVITYRGDNPAGRLPRGMVRIDSDGRRAGDIIYL